MTERTCSVNGCDSTHDARGYCSTHYSRWARTGDPHARCAACGAPIANSKRKYCSDDCKPRCSVTNCDGPVRKSGWCAAHYSQWKNTGEARPFKYKWGKEGGQCAHCGLPVPLGGGSRKYCSGACAVAEASGRPKSFTCAICKRVVNLRVRRADGRLTRTDIVYCTECGRNSVEGRRFKKYGITPGEYEAMIAEGCHICGAKDRRYHIDHDHACCPLSKQSCGKCVRGVLCGQCNQGLGLLGDDVTLLAKAIKYLNRDKG